MVIEKSYKGFFYHLFLEHLVFLKTEYLNLIYFLFPSDDFLKHKNPKNMIFHNLVIKSKKNIES